MALYAVSNQNGGTPQALASTYKSQLGINAATGATTLRRGWIEEWEVGVAAAPNSNDCPVQWDISVQTAAGTGTAAPANPKDIGGGDAAALLTYLANFTVEPTITADSSLWNLALNQRSAFRWTATDPSKRLITPAVNLKGIVLRALSPNYTGAVTVQMDVTE